MPHSALTLIGSALRTPGADVAMCCTTMSTIDQICQTLVGMLENGRKVVVATPLILPLYTKGMVDL